MLNLALMTLSAPSLERRITAMQQWRRVPPVLRAIGGVVTFSLVGLACVTRGPAARVGLPGPIRDSDPHLQPAVTKYYGNLVPTQHGEHRQLWFVFRNDWSVERHAVGTEDLVKVKDDSTSSRPPILSQRDAEAWSVNASLAKKYPDLRIASNEGTPVSNFGGGFALAGGDTVMVFWARYAQ